jgi:hypothetical protein
MSEELLPCPFCGSKDVLTDEGYDYCGSCGAMPEEGTWNTRHLSPQVEAVIEAAREWAKDENFHYRATRMKPCFDLHAAIRALDQGRKDNG